MMNRTAAKETLEKEKEKKNCSHGSAHSAGTVIIAFDKPAIGRICDNFKPKDKYM